MNLCKQLRKISCILKTNHKKKKKKKAASFAIVMQNNPEFMQSVVKNIGHFGNKSGEKHKVCHFLVK